MKDGAVTLNMQSSKAWESTVGHEITHVLEGTDAYSALQTSLFEYAKSKGEFDTRKAEIAKLYENVENADIDGELTAELISDYLFNDKSFINHLTGNRTVFQKVWDEVKYLYKVATGKEKASIEKVKREFDKVWSDIGKVEQSGVKYSVTKDIENFDNSWYNEVRLPSAEQKRVQSEALTWNADKRNQLLTQTLSNGITYRYMIDDDGIVHIYGRKTSENIHEEWGENYDNGDTEKLDTIAEELGVGPRNDNSSSKFSRDGRKPRKDDTNDNIFVSGKGRSNRTGRSKNRSNANRKPKEWHFNEDGSTEITYSDGTKETEDIAPIKEASSADGVFFDAKKYSLSNEGEQPSSVGTPLRDLALAPTQEDIAPVVEAITPMTEEEANALIAVEKLQQSTFHLIFVFSTLDNS